ncbi:hypothetical protein L6452_20710 [Arctium lappa]|uniref:Uncharacterized protein n=1 Tax=Arctium lappa TaxID=4217 RepID=A0ACB9BCY6_ARCLA|nr:hypothetical protein L6452_20710 [Arctium lappa]
MNKRMLWLTWKKFQIDSSKIEYFKRRTVDLFLNMEFQQYITWDDIDIQDDHHKKPYRRFSFENGDENGSRVVVVDQTGKGSQRSFTSDIHHGVKIGWVVLLDHATGVVISETAVIDNNVSILHNVSLGATGKVSGDKHLKVVDGFLIGIVTCVMGNISIGERAKIGTSSVVLAGISLNTTEPAHIFAPSLMLMLPRTHFLASIKTPSHPISNFRMPVPTYLPCRTQTHIMHNGDIVADHHSLTDDHSGGMIKQHYSNQSSLHDVYQMQKTYETLSCAIELCSMELSCDRRPVSPGRCCRDDKNCSWVQIDDAQLERVKFCLTYRGCRLGRTGCFSCTRSGIWATSFQKHFVIRRVVWEIQEHLLGGLGFLRNCEISVIIVMQAIIISLVYH